MILVTGGTGFVGRNPSKNHSACVFSCTKNENEKKESYHPFFFLTLNTAQNAAIARASPNPGVLFVLTGSWDAGSAGVSAPTGAAVTFASPFMLDMAKGEKAFVFASK